LTLVVLRSAFERVNEERSNDERLHYRRMLNPDSTLTRTPALDGTTATLTGTFITPHLNVLPAAIATPKPTGVRFGPIANSAPVCVRRPTSQLALGSATPCSSPPSSTTHSVNAVGPDFGL